MADSPSELHAEIEKLERKHTEHPEGRYFVPLANAYRKLGDVEHAEALLREGLRRHPDYLSAHIVLGRCLADRSATHDAVEEFQYVLSLDPQNLIALRTLGELAAADGQNEDAERWYEELLAVDPMNDEARHALETLRAAEPRPQEEFYPGAAWWEREGDNTAEESSVVEPAGPAPEQVTLDADLEEEAPLDADPSPEAEPSPEADPSLGLEHSLEGGQSLEAEQTPGEEPSLDDEPPLDAEPAADDEGSDGPTEEVVTETIAELYARQGFTERAVRVLRELIRRRGGDAALERRVAELETLGSITDAPAPPQTEPAAEVPLSLPLHTAPASLAAPAAADPDASAEAGLESSETESVDFAASFETGFHAPAHEAIITPPPAEVEAAAPIVTPAPTEAAAPAETIGSFLRALIAWTPAQEPTPEPAASVETTEEAALEPVATPEPALDPDSAPEPESASDPEVEPEVESEPEVEPQPEVAPRQAAIAEADLFPWEIPSTAAAPEPLAETAPPPAPAPVRTPPADEDDVDFFSFDAFFADASSSDTEDAKPEEPRVAQEPTIAPESSGTTEDDDDLESFQAWLRSLKH